MKNIKIFFLSSLVAMALSSCSFYNPISTNVPSYEKVGEVNVGVSLGTSADVHVSTNPVKGLSILATASTSGRLTNEIGSTSNIPQSSLYNYNKYQVELAAGFYYRLTDRIQHDIHIGYGIGGAAQDEGDIYGNYYYGPLKADINNLLIQSSLVLDFKKNFKGYLSSKFNYVTLSGYEGAFVDPYFQNYYGNSFAPYYGEIRDQNFWLNQFGIGIIGDFGPLQLTAQGQLNFRFVNNFEIQERPLGLYGGVNFNIAEIVARAKANKKD